MPKYTRIDFQITPQNIIVRRYEDGWTIQNPKIGSVETYPLDSDIMTRSIEYAKSHGWVVRTWETGARLFYKHLKPVRTRSQILATKNRLIEQFYRNHGQVEVDHHKIDLAFDM